MAEPLRGVVFRVGLTSLAAAVVFGFELCAHAAGADAGRLHRITLDTSARAFGGTSFAQYDNHRGNRIHYGTGAGVAYDALYWRHLSIGAAADFTTFWGHRDDEDPDGGYRIRALESPLLVELRAGATWWAGSSWRIDHQLGFGPSFTWFVYDENVDRFLRGWVVSLRTLVNWRAWEHVGLVGGPVVTLGGLGRSRETHVILAVAELRLGVSWEPL
jgi:hypothetical protein